MFNRNKLLFFGIGSLSFALVIWVILKIFRSKMIVGLGIIATNNISSILVLIFIIIGAITVFISLYPKIINLIIDIRHDMSRKASLSYRAKSSGPEEIREQLKLMKNERPMLKSEIDGCLKLLDRINSEFERFDQLINSNEAESLSTAREGLEEIEQILCGNLKKVINRSIVIDDNNSSAIDIFYNQYRGEISNIIEKSSKLLDEGDALLLDIVENINQKESGGVTIQLSSWREVIRGLNNDDSIKGD